MHSRSLDGGGCPFLLGLIQIIESTVSYRFVQKLRVPCTSRKEYLSRQLICLQQQGQVSSLIPILFIKYGTLDVALNKATDILYASIAELEESEQQLLDKYSSNMETCDKISKFVYGCKCACTANLKWG